MADKNKEYLIGDVSRIVGLSRDALRFYEKKGVIRANKKENGYRYFSDEDIYRLMCIVYRRKMNDSLEEIREEDENYLEAERLLRILRCVRSLKNSEDISNNSIMREFIGGGIWVK